MRISWPIVLVSVIGVILVAFHLRTRKMDFMTAANVELPPEDFGDDLAVGAPVMQPKIKDGPKINLAAQPTEDEVPVVAEITDDELGDLESAPGLDEYRSFARENPAAQLLALSSTLQARGDFQRALLALERIIDTCAQVSPEELQQASDDIASLSPTLPRWNVDPSSESELVLHFQASKNTSEEVKAAALEIATLIRKHSGDQLEITPTVETLAIQADVGSPPAALWISGPEKNQRQTALFSVRTSGDDLTGSLISGTFSSVRGYLANLGYPFPQQSENVSPEDLLSRHVTRLMWLDLAASLRKTQDEENSSN
ncbi:hypothetical protein N9283_00215 [Akkermansiaceae bacterium]|nr:hypothetical protein [Akkermansiaceae bacterium]MDB4429210.1 hypothetical protein [Akkermansiaceae bacterium]MDB4562966.1 hypothetical protein [Akkermansiaceae bacterium]